MSQFELHCDRKEHSVINLKRISPPPGEVIFLLTKLQNIQNKECERKYKCKTYALQNTQKCSVQCCEDIKEFCKKVRVHENK